MSQDSKAVSIEQLIKDLRDLSHEYCEPAHRAADILDRVIDIKPKTHPSWNCSDEFNRGWKAFHEQLTAALSGEKE